jgi:hypothetical protein
MPPDPVVGPAAHAIEGPPDALPRRCGRCRVLLEDDADLDPVAQSGWSLCAPCRLVLLPNQGKRAEAAERRETAALRGE